MFDQLFRRRAAVRRHLNSPLLQERLEYLRYCAGRGYKLYTLRQLAQDLLRIQNLLGLPTSSKAIDPAAVEATVKRCVPRRKPHSNCKNWRQKEIFSHATQWLRFLKRLRLPQVSPPVYQPDVDWQRNLLFIFIPRTKGRRTEPYPLSPTVGEAIIRYLERVRPRSSYREIFLTVEAPIRPLSGAAIWRIVAKRARALDPPVVPHGVHVLRHACATHLLEQGFSLKEIGDHLGHRNLNSTSLYASVNLTGLREVANLSLGGLL